MALSTVARKATQMPGSDVAELLTRFNDLCDLVRALAAKLDADGGVTDTDYAATVDAGVAKITNESGVEF